MSAATVLTSAMSGMPALSGTGGSLAALIRHIAPILGWSIEFDNSTDIIVIKPQSYGGGQALYYRFDDRAARGGYAPRVAEVRAYESMSDINTGAGLVGPAYIHKSYYANTTARKYYIIGDQYGIVIGTTAMNSSIAENPSCGAYIGFLNTVITGDIPVCALLGHGDGTISNLFLSTTPATASISYCFIHKNRGGTLNTGVAHHNQGGFQTTGKGMGGNDTTVSGSIGNAPDYPYYGECILSKPYINDGSSFTVRGHIPGLWVFHHKNIESVFNGVDLSIAPSSVSPVSIDDKQMVRAYCHNTTVGNIIYDAVGVVYDVGMGFRL